MPRIIVSLSIALYFAAIPGTPASGDTELDQTWLEAKIGVPARLISDYAVIGRLSEKRISEALERPYDGSRIPMVVVLHGCSGIGAEEENFLYLLTLNGFGVVMPDSFARPSRQSLCDPDLSQARVDEATYRLRQQELDRVLEELDGLPWVDHERVFLVGFSEGAAAAALYGRHAFRGVVIVGWHCQGTGPLYGLNVPADVPILAMIMKQDPWYEQHRGRHCGELFGDGRPQSRSILLDGNGHSVLSVADVESSQTAKAELLTFLSSLSNIHDSAALDSADQSPDNE